MPAVAGHELPTPGNADSAIQKKHREEWIVAGTLVLVLLTFVLVFRKGSSAQPNTSGSGIGTDPNATDQGGGSDPYAQELGTISQQIGALPGQLQTVLPKASNTNLYSTRIIGIPVAPARVTHPAAHHHTVPKRAIPVSHHVPVHVSKRRSSPVVHPTHPPQHSGGVGGAGVSDHYKAG